MQANGGQIVVDILERNNVSRVYTVPGESFLPILDGLYSRRNKIDTVVCRHEGGAGFMAEAEGKLTGAPGVCMVTRGPGACNAAIAVHVAFQDSTPMVMLIGDVTRQQRGREAFQEIDFESMFDPIAKSAVRVDNMEELPQILNEAFAVAVSGRPGPVIVALPEDLLSEVGETRKPLPEPVKHKPLDPGAMVRLHHVLHDAKRPLMLVGGGNWTQEAREKIRMFAENCNIPVCCSFRRNDIFDNNHKCYAGELGVAPHPTLLERVKSADVLIVVGARLGEITTQGYSLLKLPQPDQNLVHIHADSKELGRVFNADVEIVATPTAFTGAVCEIETTNGDRWDEWTRMARQDYLDSLVPSALPGDLDLGRAMRHLNETLPSNAILTVDAGNFSGWAQRFLSFGGTDAGGCRRFLGPTCGAMGYGAPAAVAAKLVYPDRPVIAFVGDGGMLMTGQELATAMRHDAPVIFMVFNNAMFGTIRMHQERKFPDRVIGTDLTNPDFIQWANSFGAFTARVERTDELVPAVERALESGRPAVIEVMANPEIITTRATLEKIKGTRRG